ncbi:glycosyltransferase family 4 protein [Candidatus Pyrohabitans sp.]
MKACVVLNYPLKNQIDVGHLDLLKIQFENMLNLFEKVYVLSPRDKNKYEGLFDERIKVITVPHPLLYYPSLFLDIIYMLKLSLKEDIQVFRAMAPTSGFEVILVGKILKIPCIVSIHADRKLVEKVEGKKIIKSLFLDIFEPIVLKNANKIPVISRYIRDYVLKMGVSTEKIFYHPNFVNTNIFKPANEKLTNKKDKIEIIFVGRLSPVKGADIAIKALDYIREYSVLLRIIGSGEELENLKKLTKKLNLNDKVMFHGRISHEKELPDILRNADIFVAPLTAGFSLIEAMSCGLAVVAGDIEWSREIVENNRTGILVEPYNPKALAKGIKILIEDPKLRKKLSINSRKLIIKKFSLEAWKKREIKIYKKVIWGDK